MSGVNGLTTALPSSALSIAEDEHIYAELDFTQPPPGPPPLPPRRAMPQTYQRDFSIESVSTESFGYNFGQKVYSGIPGLVDPLPFPVKPTLLYRRKLHRPEPLPLSPTKNRPFHGLMKRTKQVLFDIWHPHR